MAAALAGASSSADALVGASSSADWLHGSIRGHCGITTTVGDCDISSNGGLGLSDGAVKGGWETAVSECLGKCERCSGCRFVTVSLVFKDCSWYRNCDLDAVAPEEPFRSGAVEDLRSRASSAQGHGRVLGDGHCGATQLAERGDCARGERGSLQLAPTAWERSILPSHDLPVAIAECLQACATCARCKYVSVSTRHRDCSWHASCDRPEPTADFYWLSANASSWRAPSPVLRSTEGLGVCFSARAPQRPLVLDAAGDGAHVERALARGNVEMRREHVLWLHTINEKNAAECLFTLVSAFARMAMQPTVTWRPLWRPGAAEPEAGAVGELLHALLAQLWRDGQPVEPSDGFHDADAAPALKRVATPRRARRVRCYAAADGASTFSPLTQAFAFAPARAAYLRFHAFARRYVHLPIAVPVAATAAPIAVVLQRRPRGGIAAGRQILNEAAVLAAVHDAGFAVAGDGKAIEPHLLPVAQLIEVLGAASLLVVVHGAAVSNALFLRPGDGAVIEVFPPNMAYGSGYEVCSGARLLHLPLHLSWADGDPAPPRSLAAFRTSAFGEWICTANDRHCRVGALWTNDTLAATQHGCEAGPTTNWFRVDVCTGLARFTDLFVPLGPLATLLGAAARTLAIPPSDRPSLHGHATRGRQCPRALVLAPELAPGRVVVSVLREHGFCARAVSAPSRQQLMRASLLLSRELEAGSGEAKRLALPEDALWLRVFAGDANGSALEATPRFAHRGPQMLAFCARHPDDRRCLLSEGLLRTLVRVAKARLLPERSAASSFVGPTTSGFGRCVCGAGDAPSSSRQHMPRRLEQAQSRDDGDAAVGESWLVGGRRRGYCAVTDSEDPGDCERGREGSWGVAIDRIRSVDGCVARCRQCRKCRFITFGDGDCSWYASCARLARPAAAAAGGNNDALGAKFVSVRVRAAFGRTEAQQQQPPAATAATERCGYATLLSHPSFLPGTLTLLSSLRAGGATLPATVLATPASLRPAGTAALLRPYAQLRVLDAADEAMLVPSPKVMRVMRRKPSECKGVRAHDANASEGLADAQDCSRWQRLGTFAKLNLLEPNTTGLDCLLYLDADTIVRGNLDTVVSGSFPHALGDSARAISAAGDLGYFNSGVMLLRPSRRAFDEVRAMLAAGDYNVADDPSDQDVLIGWSQREPRRWQQLPGKLNLRVSHPAVTHERWEALSSPKVLHFAHHPKPWLAWFGVRDSLEASRRGKGGGAVARLLRTWPPITWGVDEQGVHARMSTREKRWSLLAWKDAWNMFVKEAEYRGYVRSR